MMRSIWKKIKENHFLLMVLCCMVPIVGIILLSSLTEGGSWVYYVMLLLCPLGHVFMMRGMNHGDVHDTTVLAKVEDVDCTKKEAPSRRKHSSVKDIDH